MAIRWHKVYDFDQHGKDPQALNSLRIIAVGNKRICMARFADGYFAVDNHCPHAGGPLGDGRCDEHGNVICPVHRYRYDMRTGKGKQGDYVETYPVETRKDGVYLGLATKWWWPF